MRKIKYKRMLTMKSKDIGITDLFEIWDYGHSLHLCNPDYTIYCENNKTDWKIKYLFNVIRSKKYDVYSPAYTDAEVIVDGLIKSKKPAKLLIVEEDSKGNFLARGIYTKSKLNIERYALNPDYVNTLPDPFDMGTLFERQIVDLNIFEKNKIIEKEERTK